MAHEKDFCELIGVIDRLLSDDGCPWDREQTVLTLSHMLLEEVCETIDAIPDPEHLADELGDLLVAAFFFAKAAEKEGKFSWELPFKKAKEKLIRRHPHIFEQAVTLSSEQVKDRWDDIKKKESTHATRKSVFEGIPASLPGLAMMQKLLHKTQKNREIQHAIVASVAKERENPEEALGRELAALVLKAEKQGIQAEQALRRFYAICKEESSRL